MAQRIDTKTVRKVLAKYEHLIDYTFNGGVWDDGPDGVWVALKDGFNFEGCSTLHVCEDDSTSSGKRNTAKAIAAELDYQLSRVTKGPYY